MENKYIIATAILLLVIICLGVFFYTNQIVSNDTETNNNSIVNKNNVINNSVTNNSDNLNVSKNNKEYSSDKINNHKLDNNKNDSGYNRVNIPKKYNLSYPEAMAHAKKATKDAFKNTDMDVYPKFGGFEKVHGKNVWYFEVRDKKTNKWVDGFFIDDSNGKAFI